LVFFWYFRGSLALVYCFWTAAVFGGRILCSILVTLGLALEDLGTGADSSVELRLALANLKMRRMNLTTNEWSWNKIR
jgi:hypothetical protein